MVISALVVALAATVFASVRWGVREIPFETVWEALLARDVSNPDHEVIWRQRMPRTAIGLVAGAALGVAGALLQGLTRNPIADPGLLGINAGASLAVVAAIGLVGVTDPAGFVWFAFIGGAGAAALVYAAATLGPDGPTPVTLALLGAAVTATATSAITVVLLTDQSVFADYRFWSVGALVNRPAELVLLVLPIAAVGGLLAVVSARFLDAVALGEDLARGLGQDVDGGRMRVLAAAVLLAGGATALVGPIAFVGLLVPHLARALAGISYARVVPVSAVLGPVVLLVADVIGRLLVRPAEVEAGVVVAFVGAPVLIWLVRHQKQVSM
ncbi:iron chelate uptake ABC transporter family permease subunit [Haloechinothrix salitolerans]